MNRRQFNQAMVALSISTSLPAVAYKPYGFVEPEFESERPMARIGLVSVGGADGNTVAAIAQGLRHVTRTIAIDTDAFALIASGADRRVLIGNGAHRPCHRRQAFEMARRRAGKIEAAIADLDLLIVLAGMYGAAGTGMAGVVAEVAQRSDIGVLGIAIIPTEWEGVKANPRVAYGIHELLRGGACVFPIKSHRMALAVGEEAPCVTQTVRSLCGGIGYACNQGKMVGIDIEDLPMALEPGCIGAMGFGSASGTAPIGSAINKAIAHPLMGMDKLLRATGVVINVRGPALQLSHLCQATRGVRSLLKNDVWLYYSGSIDETIGDEVIVSILAAFPEATSHTNV